MIWSHPEFSASFTSDPWTNPKCPTFAINPAIWAHCFSLEASWQLPYSLISVETPQNFLIGCLHWKHHWQHPHWLISVETSGRLPLWLFSFHLCHCRVKHLSKGCLFLYKPNQMSVLCSENSKNVPTPSWTRETYMIGLMYSSHSSCLLVYYLCSSATGLFLLITHVLLIPSSWTCFPLCLRHSSPKELNDFLSFPSNVCSNGTLPVMILYKTEHLAHHSESPLTLCFIEHLFYIFLSLSIIWWGLVPFSPFEFKL